jgi:hypothetical protein
MRYLFLIILMFVLTNLAIAQSAPTDVQKPKMDNGSPVNPQDNNPAVKSVAPTKAVKMPMKIESRARANSPSSVGRPVGNTGNGKPDNAGRPAGAGNPAGNGMPGKGKGKPPGVGKPGG